MKLSDFFAVGTYPSPPRNQGGGGESICAYLFLSVRECGVRWRNRDPIQFIFTSIDTLALWSTMKVEGIQFKLPIWDQSYQRSDWSHSPPLPSICLYSRNPNIASVHWVNKIGLCWNGLTLPCKWKLRMIVLRAKQYRMIEACRSHTPRSRLQNGVIYGICTLFALCAIDNANHLGKVWNCE